MIEWAGPGMARWRHPSGGELWTFDPVFRDPLDRDHLAARLAPQVGDDVLTVGRMLAEIERGTGASLSRRSDRPLLYTVVTEYRCSPGWGPRESLLEALARRLGIHIETARERVEEIERLTGRCFDHPAHRAIITVAVSISCSG